MDDDCVVTLEIDDEGCGQLRFELPPDTPEHEIEYFKTLVPREELGSIELLDPETHEVVYFLRPLLLH
jgi:hypothetical protein